MPPGLWRFRRWIQIEPCSCQSVCRAIAWSGYWYSYAFRRSVFFIITGQIIWIKRWLTKSRILCIEGNNISNNSSFRLKHPGVPDGSDGSGGTSYLLTDNQTRLVAQATGRVAYLPCGGYYTMPLILATRRVVYYAHRSGVRLPSLCVRNVVTYTHHQNDTYVTLFAGVTVMQ